MGCAPSKIDSDDTVRRCKDRRRLMKEAVFSRHHLAAAHSDYCRALISTGSALVSFASGEPLSVSDNSPTAAAAAATAHSPSPPPPMSTAASSRHHRPPRRRKQPIKLPHILSDSSFTASPPPNHDFFTNNVRSNSTYATTPSQASSIWNWENLYPPPSPPDSEFFDHLNPTGIPANNNNDDEDSSSSSSDDHIDNDNIAPAFSSNSHRNPHTKQFDDLESNSSPHSRRSGINQSRQFDDLESNYSKHSSRSEINQTRKFDDLESNYSSNSRRSGINQPRKFDDLESNYSTHSRRSGINQPRKFDDLESNYSTHSRRSEIKQTWKFDDLESNYSTYSGINQRRNFSKKIGGEETEREEIECSEWGDHDHDHYSSSSSDEGDLQSRSDYGVRNDMNSKYSSKLDKISSDDDDAKQGANSETRIVVRHRNLVEIVAALMENFNKAAAAGEQVTEMLEASRDQLDRSFKLLRKRVYHSSGMLSTLSSSWTSKPPLRVKYRFEPTSVEQPGGPKSLCSTLERLLAWEKKLYQEVKAREGVKIEHEKKLSVLQGQEYRGDEEAKLDKTKASIKRLQSLMVVTSQAVSATSSAIVGLRDSDLIPQLVELCHGFMYMWRSMNRSHALQNDVVQQVKGLVHRASKGEPTSDPHRQATADLESAVSAWHATFGRVIKFQRHLARALHGWFKLTLVPVHNGPATRGELPEVLAFFDEWRLSLERVPDTVASEAIISFNNVVHSIHAKQIEEAKVKKRAAASSRELERKASAIRNLERKYYNSYSMVGLGPPDTGPGNGQMLDARDPLAEKKAELAAYRRRVEDEMIKHAKAVEVTRAMTLNNIQTGLPGVFQAMTSFSAMMAEALDSVCTRSYAI